jgi:hypothetical protein
MEIIIQKNRWEVADSVNPIEIITEEELTELALPDNTVIQGTFIKRQTQRETLHSLREKMRDASMRIDDFNREIDWVTREKIKYEATLSELTSLVSSVEKEMEKLPKEDPDKEEIKEEEIRE